MTTNQLIIFIAGTVFLIGFSWFLSIKEGRYHGVPRFFAFEGLLFLFLLQRPLWFKDPLSVPQVFSWLFLFISTYYVIAAVVLYHRHTDHGQNFENSTRLVTSGLYKYIRHPMYGSLLFLGWGMFLKHINLMTTGIVLFITIALYITAKVEEKEMIKKFGDEYREYMKKSSMWIPGVI